MTLRPLLPIAAATLAAALAYGASLAMAQSPPSPQESALRKALGARLEGLPAIDEVAPAPIPGLFEVRIGNDIFYTDATGDYLLRGELLDLKSKRNLTAERIDKLSAIDFASLPLNDALVWKTGNGKRRIAVFADPNCGYCKRFESELTKVKDLTVYTFLIPILGDDSLDKAKSIWCAKDRNASWRSWMIEGTSPSKSAAASCTTPIDRNLALSRKHRVNGTPAIVFENGTRVPGMLNADQLEKQLASVAGKG